MPGSPPPMAPGVHTVLETTEAFFGYYPGSVAVVTARDGACTNAMSAGWHTALSAKPPLYGVAIAPQRHTYGLVRASGWFGVNFLPFEQAEAIAGAGLLSGADEPDKLDRLGLAYGSDLAGAPILTAAYLAYACRLKEVVPTGDHDLFVGEVARVHYDERAFDGRIKSRVHSPATIYYGRSIYESLGQGRIKQVLPEEFRRPRPDGGAR